ncbi:ArsR/SmtB family transcription factor [Nonomuraea glycinis]
MSDGLEACQIRALSNQAFWRCSPPARVVDLTGELGLAQSTVSKHLACLRDCGLIDYRAEGRQSFYALTRPELMDLLASAEQLLAATGHTAALRPEPAAGR